MPAPASAQDDCGMSRTLEYPAAQMAPALEPGPHRLPPAQSSGIWGSELLWLVVGVPFIALALWISGGGVALMATSTEGALTGIGQLTGLASGLGALGGLALAARPAVVERRFGLDHMLGWHRWTGMITVFALVVHVGSLVAAYSMRSGLNLWQELVFLFDQDWMPSAMVAALLMLLVALTSWHRVKNRMAYETWYYLHVLGYLAVALALGHVLVMGSDFITNPMAKAWWIGMYVAVAALIVWSRIRPLVLSLLRPMRVSGVEHLPDGAVSVWVAGSSLRRHRVSAGQFYSLRFGVPGLWWQSHPYSLSAEPYAEGLRFTFAPGDDAEQFRKIKPGTRVWLEGPYGRFTADRAESRKVVMVAGGSGIAPLRAMLADITPDQQPEVLMRVSNRNNAWFVAELEHLLAAKNGRLTLVAGPRVSLRQDPFAAEAIRALIPDIDSRSAFICGPTGMARAASRGLSKAGVKDIYMERYGY